MIRSQFASLACVALTVLGAAACSSAPGSSDDSSSVAPSHAPEGAIKTESAIGPPTISTHDDVEIVRFTGWNMTPGGSVWVGSWDGSKWLAGMTVTATSGTPCTRFPCFYGGTISDVYRNPAPVNVTVFAYDYASGTWSNGVAVHVSVLH